MAGVLTLLTTSSYFVFGDLRWKWYIPASIFLGSFVLYTFHRLYKIDFIPKDHLGHRHRFVIIRGNWMKLSMAFAVFMALLILPAYSTDAIVWLVPAAIVSIGYTIPFIPAEKKWWRLRDIPLGKPVIIAGVVTYLTLSFPVFEQWGIEELGTPTHLVLFVERFLFILSVTIPFEHRDKSADQDAGLQTIATVLGFQRTKLVGIGVMIAWFCSTLVATYATHAISWVMLGIVMSIALAIGYKQMNERRGEFYYTIVFEGAIACYSTLLIVLSNFQ